MRTNLKRFAALAGMAVVAAGVTVVPGASPATAAPLPPGAPASGPVTISPATGTSSTTFQVTPPIGADCPGSGDDGYRYNTYITPLANDPATLDYAGNGTVGPLPTQNLRNAAGTQLRAISPAIGNNFLAQQTASFTSGAFSAANLPPGEYWIGFACTVPDSSGTGSVDVEEYWATAITITAQAGAGTNNFTYSVGVRPQPPVLNTATAGDGQITAAFTPGAADPAATSFLVSATPVGGGAAVTQTGAASPITVTGLTNGTAYDVTVTATNTVGTSSPSNTLQATPSLSGQPPVQNPSAIPGAETCTVSFLPPTGATPTGYTVTVDPAITGSPFSVPAGGPYTLELTGLTAGTEYDVTILAQYAAPDFGTPVTLSCIPTSAQFIVQEVSVTRPPGALVLTQRCGVYGSLDSEGAVNAFPGYPFDLASPPTVAGPGTAPTLDAAGTTPDPGFADYPNPIPASYPTYCGIDLGTAELVTNGDLAGYYAAAGRLNQVTVLDTRDGDPGWTLNGEMSAFDDGFGVTFPGSYLGWTPRVTDVTATPGYTQVVAAGAGVQPGTGIPGDTGLGDGEVLASATSGQGLGAAILDARIKLLIPPTVPAGDYSGELTLSFL